MAFSAPQVFAIAAMAAVALVVRRAHSPRAEMAELADEAGSAACAKGLGGKRQVPALRVFENGPQRGRRRGLH